ncbi:hypothetical protein C1J03_08465 [Sulfitobacter sp. SK012]|uniref:hypothetical protein n=1 Tax=Sulfitobacter sp. SK012 TaxID=1389005 RepID=UPI000E0AFBD4|nr:hypothetical protein [Sulfitobacter sp. SK012]AXI46045.1 hypothetical protein C1J03_08465 [Sulfitobacter sp. SK012]
MGLPTPFRKTAIEAGQQGGFSHGMARHFACHFKRDDTLVVTFDHMKARDLPVPRYPWGYGPLAARGHSHLGIMMRWRNDWFRHTDLFDFFDDLRDSGFFQQYRRVLFYGSSMGGFGACAFASAAPGADVLALMPQSTLASDLVPFETRYAAPRLRGDWSDPRYRDGADGLATARRAHLVYDPYFAPDRAHADRMQGAHIQHLKCFYAGHKAGRLLHLTGRLLPLLDDVLEGELNPFQFQRDYRELRRSSVIYDKMLRNVIWARADRDSAASGRASAALALKGATRESNERQRGSRAA